MILCLITVAASLYMQHVVVCDIIRLFQVQGLKCALLFMRFSFLLFVRS